MRQSHPLRCQKVPANDICRDQGEASGSQRGKDIPREGQYGLVPKVVEKPEKVYDVTYLMIYKKTCHRRPRDMRVIELPLKSKGAVAPVPEEEPGEGETSESIRNIRILLNKLSKDNFARISDTILNNFAYNQEILEQLTVRQIPRVG